MRDSRAEKLLGQQEGVPTSRREPIEKGSFDEVIDQWARLHGFVYDPNATTIKSEHHHRFTVPVEYTYTPDRFYDGGGLKEHRKYSATKLKCESCPAIEEVQL